VGGFGEAVERVASVGESGECGGTSFCVGWMGSCVGCA